jgi:hypothetical protein
MYSATAFQLQRNWFAVCDSSIYDRRDTGPLQDSRVAYLFDPESVRSSMEDVGVCLMNGVLEERQLKQLRDAFPASVRDVRNLLDMKVIRELACSEKVRSLAAAVLGESCFAIRGIFFDNPAEANWKTRFHQGLTIAVKYKKDAPGFGDWTVKGGVHHVQPPMEILRRIVSVRLHLDDSRSDNAPLKIFRGTHRMGRLSPQQIEEIIRTETPVECRVPAGAALMMSPLLVHGLAASMNSTHRRVIHLDFAAGDLPHGLEWNQRVCSA